MEKGKGKEKSQSESNAEDDPKPDDTTTIVLRNFFQQVLLKDQSSPSQTNQDGSYLNTAQVVEKLAHKEPALLYFYHKIFPDADYEKVVTEMVAKVIREAEESAKSPKMKPRPYVPPPPSVQRRSRTSDFVDKASTLTDEEEARKLVLLSNLQGILREAIMLNELQEESQRRSELAPRLGVGRRVDMLYTPASTSQVKIAETVNEQESQAAPSPDLVVKDTIALPPPPSVVPGLKSEGSDQTCSQASTSKGKAAETTNEQHNQVLPTNSSNPVNVKFEEERSALSEAIRDLVYNTIRASTSKGKSAKKVDEQKVQAASGSDNIKEKASVPPPPVVVDLKAKSEGDHQKHSTSTQAATSKGKGPEITNQQTNRATPVSNFNPVNVDIKVDKEKAALTEVVIDFISKADTQKYFTFSQALTSNGKNAEKVNEQKETTLSSEPVDVREKVAPPPVVAEPKSKGDGQKQSTSAQASINKGKNLEKVDVVQESRGTPSSDPINVKVKVAPPPPSAAADLKSKESDQKQSRSAEASTSNGKSSSDHIKVKAEKDGFVLPLPPPLDADLTSKESDQKHSTRSTRASTSDQKPASRPDPINIKVEKERAAPPPPPPPVRCRPKMEDTRQQEEIYVTSAHARERADKSRLRQAQDAHLRSGGRVVPKPEPVNNNPIQEEVKPKPTEKGKEREEKKPEPIRTQTTGQSGPGTRAGSSKPETTVKPESKPTENKSSKDTSSPKVSSGTQTEPVKEAKATESSYVPREETRSQYQYQYRPASSPPPKPRPEGPRGSASANGYGYARPLPSRGESYTARCSGITNEGRQCLIVVRTTYDGESLKPFCQWHGEYYGSTKPKSLDPNKKERGRCSATTQMGTLCKRSADHYSSKSEYGYCWQHERMYGYNSVYS